MKHLGYNIFKNNRGRGNTRYKIQKVLNEEISKISATTGDNSLDFCMSLYSEFTEEKQNLSKSFFDKVLENIDDICREKVAHILPHFINIFNKVGGMNDDILMDLFVTVYGIYCNEIQRYCINVCSEYVYNDMYKQVSSLVDTGFIHGLVYFDHSFKMLSAHRLQLVQNKIENNCIYMNEILIEEFIDKICIKLKSNVEDCLYSILKDIAILSNLSDVLDSVIDSFIMGSNLPSLVNEDGNRIDKDNANTSHIKREYIDDYKKLNKLALSNGFEYVRCNGDHGIYKNNNGIVVIPQGRTIGKGLSLKIQKMIAVLSEDNAEQQNIVS